MNFQLRSVALAVGLSSALLLSIPAHAATTNLGQLSQDWTWFGNNLSAGTTTFTDYYTFSLGGTSEVGGNTFELDIGNWLNVDLSSITLTGSSLGAAVYDYNPNDGFSFKNLVGGTYQLAVSGQVTGWTGGSYIGAVHAIAVPVPEPEDYAITLVGLAGVGLLLRRRKSA